ncbi:MAG: hypothetical protein ACTHMM_04010 [Agriterribacter sp.]
MKRANTAQGPNNFMRFIGQTACPNTRPGFRAGQPAFPSARPKGGLMAENQIPFLVINSTSIGMKRAKTLHSSKIILCVINFIEYEV